MTGVLPDETSWTVVSAHHNEPDDEYEHTTNREIVKMMVEEPPSEKEKRFHRFLRTAITDIVPRNQRNDYHNYNCCPPPIFIPIITIAEIIVFVVYKFEMDSRGSQTTATTGVPLYSPLVYVPARRYEVWRFLTYMFIHQGYIHLFFNIIFQLPSGILLEIIHKWWRVGLIYLIGVFTGGLAHSIIDHRASLVGASGGVYALFGAHLAAIIINWKEINYKCLDTGSMEDGELPGKCRAFRSAPVRLAIILILIIPDTALAIYRRVTAPEEQKVGVAAHIGGLLAGVLCGFVIMYNLNKLAWEKTLGWISLAVFLVGVVFCCLFNAIYDGYPPTDYSGY